MAEPQFAAKVRISKSADDSEGLIETIVSNLAELYGDPRIRRTPNAITATWSGFEIADGSDRSILSLIAAVLMLTDRPTIKIYRFDRPRRNPSKREFRQNRDKYMAELAARHKDD